MILSYPVITMDESLTHMGSRIAIMGESPSREMIDALSVEKHVTADTPPTFLFHTDEDTSVPAENSIAFYMALRKAHVPAELHIFQPGIHGVALAGEYPLLCGWPEIMHAWMKGQGFLP
jgi:dipeptidyl aminopeptidase/acylaminoacyl peptidase